MLLERLDRGGHVPVDDGVELLREAGLEVVAAALGRVRASRVRQRTDARPVRSLAFVVCCLNGELLLRERLS